MSLREMDRVIRELERPPLFRDYTGTDYDTCAYCHEPVGDVSASHHPDCAWASALATLRSMRERAVGGYVSAPTGGMRRVFPEPRNGMPACLLIPSPTEDPE